MLSSFIILCLNLFIFSETIANQCIEKKVEYGIVCQCNSTYCDTVPPLLNLKSGSYQLYSTSSSRLGFESVNGTFTNNSDSATVSVTVDLGRTYQKIIGFGGAFTDSAGINIALLPDGAQQKLLESYFGNDGIQYSLGRVPIGCTDFSTRGYTYCDEKDETLEKFSLQDEDYKYKIPIILKAKALRNKQPLLLFASAWTAPKWMKSNNDYTRFGVLKSEYYELWAKYYLKFFDAYENENVTFWGVTTQNEPEDGITGINLPNIGFTPSKMVKWIKTLGPAIRNSSFKSLKIILHDDNRYLLTVLKLSVLSDAEVLKYADGIGVHWYIDFITPKAFLEFGKSDKKDLFLLGTEACNGYFSFLNIIKKVELGSWTRGQNYISNILDDLEYNVAGWNEWNLALDENGGPNWVNNQVDAPIIVNKTSGEFYKQPTFYVLGHFSKFLVPDSVRLSSSASGDKNVRTIAFRRPDGKIAVILNNKSSGSKKVAVNVDGSSQTFDIPAKSINTLLYMP